MKNIEECYDELYKVYDMSCKPTMEKVKKGDIIDEDQSVRWNREEVLRRMKAYDDEVKALNTAKNKARDKAYANMYKAIQREIKGISLETAQQIFDVVTEQEDGECKENHVIAMYDLIELINKCIKDVRG